MDAGSEAEKAVRDGRVKLYLFRPSQRGRWIVVGRHADYLVLPNAGYCSCNDFFFRVMGGGKPTCYHLEAVKLARSTRRYETIEEEDGWHDTLMDEWLQRKPTRGPYTHPRREDPGRRNRR